MSFLTVAVLALLTPPTGGPTIHTTDRLCFLWTHPNAIGGTATLLAPHASVSPSDSGDLNPFSGQFPGQVDSSFFRYQGSAPIRAAFGADVDGDGADELFVLREIVASGGDYLLSMHESTAFEPKLPAQLNASKALARTAKGAIGSRAQFGAIIAADGLDVDGDGRDEMMVVRQVETGAQRLEVYRLPASLHPSADSATKGAAKSKVKAVSAAEFGGVIASYLDVGDAKSGGVEDIAAVDANADGKEEIAILARESATSQSIRVVAAPVSVGEGAPNVLAIHSPIGIPSSDLSPILEIEGVDADCDGLDELLIRRRSTISPSIGIGFPADTVLPDVPAVEVDRLTLNGLPTTSPFLTADGIGSTILWTPVGDTIVLRGPNPKPGSISVPLDELLNASFTGAATFESTSFQAIGYTGSTTVATETFGPFDGTIGKFDGAKFTLQIPGASKELGGTLHSDTGVIDLIDPVSGAKGIQVVVPDPHSSFVLQLNVSSMRLIAMGSLAIVTCSAEGKAIPVGGNQSITLTKGSFEFRIVGD